MNKILKFTWSWVVIVVIAIAIFSLLPLLAQSSKDVNSDLFSLRSRVSQLESEVRRLSQSVSRLSQSQPQNSPNYNPPSEETPYQETPDPMFQRLATLVIELKEELRALETKVAEIEETIQKNP